MTIPFYQLCAAAVLASGRDITTTDIERAVKIGREMAKEMPEREDVEELVRALRNATNTLAWCTTFITEDMVRDQVDAIVDMQRAELAKWGKE